MDITTPIANIRTEIASLREIERAAYRDAEFKMAFEIGRNIERLQDLIRTIVGQPVTCRCGSTKVVWANTCANCLGREG